MQGRTTRRPTIRVFGYHPTGSTGTLFLFGILVGAVALPELRVLTPDALRPASNVTWRSSTEPATPGSNTNSEPTAPRSQRRPDERGGNGGAEVHYWVAGHADRQWSNVGQVDEARSRGL